MKAFFISVCLGLFIQNVFALPTNKIVVFGDSLSDTGNLYEYMHRYFPPSPPYYAGRASNGPLWIEYVLAHYYPGATEGHVLNYAVMGSGVGSEIEDDDDAVVDDAVFNFSGQLQKYFSEQAEPISPSALHIVWIGADNYIHSEDLDADIKLTIEGIQRGVNQLVEKGAKQIMLIGLPDFGLSPLARKSNRVESLTYLSTQHSFKIQQLVAQFKQRYPDVQWIFQDVQAPFLDAIAHPDVYGFTNVTTACFDDLGYSALYALGLKGMREKVQPPRDGACDEHLFVDAAHVSTRAHAIIAQEVIASLDKSELHFE
ncbi:MAG: SGNH/GDSL hydrolase family protein [Legionellaceae bacterium]|nr:SGNH/GDSL hydrolase family protein [Legionellaceae bacterium]